MQDVNDLIYFAAVVRHRGFAPAARALKEPKSKLSRRIARLEDRLKVRLLERSTRRFRVTDVGIELFRHCETIAAEVEAAENVVAHVRSEPSGLVRISSPFDFNEPILAEILPNFLRAHPHVRLQLIATSRRVDLIEERVDVALRVRTKLDTDPELTMRVLGHSHIILVASPDLIEKCGQPASPNHLAAYPTISMSEQPGPDIWELISMDGRALAVRHEPRLSSSDLNLLLSAACAGLGVALLPDRICRRAIADGALVHVLPEWSGGEGTIHLVFTSRRGLLPAVRAFIDYVADELPKALRCCEAIQLRDSGAASLTKVVEIR